jgi:hypothetical protein
MEDFEIYTGSSKKSVTRALSCLGPPTQMNQHHVFSLMIFLLILIIILYFLNQTTMALILIFGVLILAIVGWCHTDRGMPWSDRLSRMLRRPPEPKVGGCGPVAPFSGSGSTDVGVFPPVSAMHPQSSPYMTTGGGADLGGVETVPPQDSANPMNFAPTRTDQSVRFTWLPQLPSFNVFGST